MDNSNIANAIEFQRNEIKAYFSTRTNTTKLIGLEGRIKFDNVDRANEYISLYKLLEVCNDFCWLHINNMKASSNTQTIDRDIGTLKGTMKAQLETFKKLNLDDECLTAITKLQHALIETAEKVKKEIITSTTQNRPRNFKGINEFSLDVFLPNDGQHAYNIKSKMAFQPLINQLKNNDQRKKEIKPMNDKYDRIYFVQFAWAMLSSTGCYSERNNGKDHINVGDTKTVLNILKQFDIDPSEVGYQQNTVGSDTFKFGRDTLQCSVKQLKDAFGKAFERDKAKATEVMNNQTEIMEAIRIRRNFVESAWTTIINKECYYQQKNGKEQINVGDTKIVLDILKQFGIDPSEVGYQKNTFGSDTLKCSVKQLKDALGEAFDKKMSLEQKPNQKHNNFSEQQIQQSKQSLFGGESQYSQSSLDLEASFIQNGGTTKQQHKELNKPLLENGHGGFQKL